MTTVPEGVEIRAHGQRRREGMHLTFESDELRALCGSNALLTRRFGPHGILVRRRILVLWNAQRLGDVTVRPPDRRRLEPGFGPRALSVCARDAGRIYFRALRIAGNPAATLEDVDSVEIFAIGDGSRETS
jgi:hypothetical protein